MMNQTNWFPQNSNNYPRVHNVPLRPWFHKSHFQRPMPSYNMEHWCETCDRSFPTADLLENHKNQHQKCNIDGCQFIAHPKVVTKHIQMQHASGLYKKIANINNPEEIKKWRDERKKRYPTKENIEKKAAEIKEKINRGEKLGLRHNGPKRNFNSGESIRKKHQGFGNQNQPQKRHKPEIRNNTSVVNKNKKTILQNKITNVSNVNELRKLPPFAGIQDIIQECMTEQTEILPCDLDIDDEVNDLSEKPEPPINVNSMPTVCGALSTLMCNYDSSEDELSETVSNKNLTVKVNSNSHLKFQNKSCVEGIVSKDADDTKSEQNNTLVKSDDDSGPEEVKVIKIDETDSKIISEKASKMMKKDKTNIVRKQILKRPKFKVPSTLLQKLLHSEIKHERNIILQCIRHVVKNNFFSK